MTAYGSTPGLGIDMAQHNVGGEVLPRPAPARVGPRQVMRRVGKHAAARTLDSRTWNDHPATRPPGHPATNQHTTTATA